jgi:hypothetical protein
LNIEPSAKAGGFFCAAERLDFRWWYLGLVENIGLGK